MIVGEREFWEATFVAVVRALSVNPGRHRMADGNPASTPAPVAELAGEIADAALVERNKRWAA